MSPRIEDLIGKLLLIGTFCILLEQQLLGLVRTVTAPVHPPYWLLGVVQWVLAMFFVGMIVVMTVRRLPPRSSAVGWIPRADAIGGTFMVMLLVYVAPGAAPVSVQLLAIALMLIGAAGSIYCLRYLGRSFAMVAAARELVTRGPYGQVRHPLYLAEGLTILGIVIGHWSIAAVGLGIIQMALQFRRMQHEERVLRGAFPEYEAYAARVPMVVPGLA